MQTALDNLPSMELVDFTDVCKQDGTIFTQRRWYQVLHVGLIDLRHVALRYSQTLCSLLAT